MTTEASAPRALILSDESALIEPFTEAAKAHGFAVHVFSCDVSTAQIEEIAPSVVVLGCDDDLGPARRVLDELGLDSDAEILLVGASAGSEQMQAWLSQSRIFFLSTPLDADYLSDLLADVRGELERYAGAATPAQSAALDQFGLLRGSSRPMRVIYRVLRKLAPLDTSVLVHGESGTGKELVARTLHEASPRSDSDFVAINCGAIPEGLVESELFGHEKGSFSGARSEHRGVFERAHGGTLFLDEITEMHPDMQVTLLRVLETGRLRRVGAENEISADVRIIAATNEAPEAAIEKGRLREDLYFRLARYVVRMPPLREREGDLLGLAEQFLEALNREHGTDCRFSDAALEALKSHHWPGNVRELRSAVERAYLLADGEIRVADLPDWSADAPDLTGADYLSVSVGTSIEETERRLILATLEAYDGDKSAAAEALGISLRTLYNRLQLYGRESNGEALSKQAAGD